MFMRLMCVVADISGLLGSVAGMTCVSVGLNN